MSTLFPGEASPLPLPMNPGTRGSVLMRPSAGPMSTAPLRHASGYDPFVALVERAGADPVALASDIAAFGAFVHASRESLTDPSLAEAAAVFLGNLLVVLHPRASWRVTTEPEVGTEAVSMPVRGALAAMRDQPEFTRRMARELTTRWAEADERRDAIASALESTRAATDVASASPSPEFVAPLIAVGPFLDEDGDPIPYGARWDPADGPPDDAYSRVTHPERFAPLHAAAEALIAHLERHYEVETTRTAGPRPTVALRPRRGAPIRVEFTEFPAVRLRAGLLLHETLPSCGCDACDEDAATEVDALVQSVLAVVTGGYAERLASGTLGATSLRLPDGGERSSGRLELPDVADRLIEPEAVLALDGAAWPAWPMRG